MSCCGNCGKAEIFDEALGLCEICTEDEARWLSSVKRRLDGETSCDRRYDQGRDDRMTGDRS